MIKRVLVAIMLLSFSLLVLGGCLSSKAVRQQHDLDLVTIQAVEIDDYAVILQLSGDNSAAFTVHKPSDPYTAVVEMPGVGIGDLPEKIQSNKLGISQIRMTMVQTPIQLTRVEILMDAPLDVEPVKVGNSVVINVLTPQQEIARTEAVDEISRTPSEELLPATEVMEFLMERGAGEIRFTVYADGIMEPDIFTLPGRIIIDIPSVDMKATLPEKVYKPISGIRYGSYKDKIRVVLDMDEDGDFAASTEDNTVVIIIPTGDLVEQMLLAADEKFGKTEEIAATMPEAGAAKPGINGAGDAASFETSEEDEFAKKYHGERISLDFQGSEIVPIFRLIGEIAGYNTVIHPKVSGTITLKLKDVPWDQALDIVLEISGMGKDIRGNILRIAPADIFIRQKESEQKIKKAEVQAEDLVQVAIHLNHISAEEMMKRIKEAKLMTPRGTLRIDERTNTIILNDTTDSIRKIRNEEVVYWDTPQHGTMQVLIEAKIVSVRTDYTHNFGIRWGGSGNEQNFSWLTDRTTLDFAVNTPFAQAGSGAAQAGGLFSIGYAETVQVDLSIEALETVKKAKSLANPRVMTIDKQSATISQGTAIPYATQAEGGGTTIQTTDATLSLTVTPEIRPNGIIMLDVQVTNDAPTVIPGAVAPGIDKQQIKTKALVKDGETLVLGGIFTSQEDESEVRVPVLSKIPVLGWLFKTRSVTKIPSELLIFITPKIIKS